MSRTRTRLLDSGPVFLGTERSKTGVEIQQSTPFVSKTLEEITDELHAGPPYRTGGPMALRRSSLVAGLTGAQLRMPGFGSQGTYSGNLRATGLSFNSTLPTIPNWSSLEAEAWNRFKPGKPIVDLGVFLGELREFPALLRQTALGFLKIYSFFRNSAGRHNWNHNEVARAFLGYEFGWAPFISDVKKLINVQHELEKRLEQLRRDNGRPIRRGGMVRSTNTTSSTGETVTGQTFHPQVFNHGFYVTGSGRVSTVTTSTMRAWFSGRFRYNIPGIDGAGWRRRAMVKLLGLNVVSPDVVWNLMPWSWLIDWFTNIGDVLENMSANAAENLRADYAYLMVHVANTTYANVRSNFYKDGVPTTFSGTSASVSEYKLRSAASPFGFGLDDADLSVRQLAILSALGLSKT